jgi:prepilin-type N-terminal cleavage/methylation domain-containing protein
VLTVRRALSLFEILVAVVILGLLTAALYPTMMPKLRAAQVTSIATQLDGLRVAIGSYRQDVRRYPRRLYQLTHALAPGDLDACGSAVSGAARSRWDGPYIARSIEGNFPVGDATMRDTLGRSPSTTGGGPFGQLQLVVVDVDSLTANSIETQFDGVVDYAAGNVLWTAAGKRLTFQIPINGC